MWELFVSLTTEYVFSGEGTVAQIDFEISIFQTKNKARACGSELNGKENMRCQEYKHN
jgi:hypothetical protein